MEDMSLDSIIKANHALFMWKSGGKYGSAAVPQRRGETNDGHGVIKRFGGIQKTKNVIMNTAWNRGGPQRGGESANRPGTLHVSNLEYNVSYWELKNLFSDFPSLSKVVLHYDRFGRPLGTARILFGSVADALEAIKFYHRLPLNGRPINIQLVTNNASLIVERCGMICGAGGNSAQRWLRGSPPNRGNAGDAAQRYGDGPQRGTLGVARGGGWRNNVEELTVEELDAELDAYINERNK